MKLRVLLSTVIPVLTKMNIRSFENFCISWYIKKRLDIDRHVCDFLLEVIRTLNVIRRLV